MEWNRVLKIDADDTIADLLHSAYSRGWCDGYNEKGVEFDWIDERFSKYLKELSIIVST